VHSLEFGIGPAFARLPRRFDTLSELPRGLDLFGSDRGLV